MDRLGHLGGKFHRVLSLCEENPCIGGKAWESCVNRKEHQISITNCLVDYCVSLLTGKLVNSTVPFRVYAFLRGFRQLRPQHVAALFSLKKVLVELRIPRSSYESLGHLTNPSVILRIPRSSWGNLMNLFIRVIKKLTKFHTKLLTVDR